MPRALRALLEVQKQKAKGQMRRAFDTDLAAAVARLREAGADDEEVAVAVAAANETFDAAVIDALARMDRDFAAGIERMRK